MSVEAILEKRRTSFNKAAKAVAVAAAVTAVEALVALVIPQLAFGPCFETTMHWKQFLTPHGIVTLCVIYSIKGLLWPMMLILGTFSPYSTPNSGSNFRVTSCLLLYRFVLFLNNSTRFQKH